MKNIFIACDTNNIQKIKKIIRQRQFRLKEYRIGYKFCLEFFGVWKHAKIGYILILLITKFQYIFSFDDDHTTTILF